MRHEQQANFNIHFTELEQTYSYGDYSYSYGGDIGGGTSEAGKASLTLTNSSKAETVKVTGLGYLDIEKALHDAIANNQISCKNGENITDLLTQSDAGDYDYGDMPSFPSYDLRSVNEKTSVSFTHKASAPNYQAGNYSLKITSSFDFDVAEVCTGKTQSGNWYPSNETLNNPKSLSCKAGPAIKVKVNYTASGESSLDQPT